MKKRTILLIFFFFFFSLFSHASPTTQTTSRSPKKKHFVCPLVWKSLHKHNDAHVRCLPDPQHPQGLLLQIQSATGLGTLRLVRTTTTWPKHLTLHIKIRGLEGLHIQAAHLALSSGLSHQQTPPRAFPTIVTDLSPQRSSKTMRSKDFSFHISPLDQQQRPLKDAAAHDYKKIAFIRIAFPKALLSLPSRSLSVRWIDYYRR